MTTIYFKEGQYESFQMRLHQCNLKLQIDDDEHIHTVPRDASMPHIELSDRTCLMCINGELYKPGAILCIGCYVYCYKFFPKKEEQKQESKENPKEDSKEDPKEESKEELKEEKEGPKRKPYQSVVAQIERAYKTFFRWKGLPFDGLTLEDMRNPDHHIQKGMSIGSRNAGPTGNRKGALFENAFYLAETVFNDDENDVKDGSSDNWRQEYYVFDASTERKSVLRFFRDCDAFELDDIDEWLLEQKDQVPTKRQRK